LAFVHFPTKTQTQIWLSVTKGGNLN